jgi:predicted amidophosphoribosyltransferase
MTRKSKQKKKQGKGPQQHHHAVIGPAPFLVKKHISLTDIIAEGGSTSAGIQQSLLNGNGYTSATVT